jgi:hypothetical protein
MKELPDHGYFKGIKEPTIFMKEPEQRTNGQFF